ncbi:MAG: hypothetical protein AMXMBFR75_30330, partial [Candidatus Hinthialibacteria bacterium]
YIKMFAVFGAWGGGFCAWWGYCLQKKKKHDSRRNR